MSQTNCVFYLRPKGPRGPTSYRFLKAVTMSLKETASSESRGYFLQTRRKTQFYPILSLFGVKNSPKYVPRRTIFYTLLKIVPVSLKDFIRVKWKHFAKYTQNYFLLILDKYDQWSLMVRKMDKTLAGHSINHWSALDMGGTDLKH